MTLRPIARRAFAVSVALASISAVAAVAQEAAPSTRRASQAHSEEPPVVLRTYDVSDLVRPTRDYPAGSVGEAGQRGANAASAGGNGVDPAQVASQMSEALSLLLRNSVDVSSWRENGGVTGSIQMMPSNTMLVVGQTEANHAQIARLLADLRGQQGVQTMVAVRASWLLLEPADVDAVYARARKERPAGATMGPAVVDDATAARAKVYCQGQNTCFNGQTVSVTSGREWTVVTAMTPVVAANAVGYQATTGRATSGVTLQVTPQLMPDGASVVLDLQSLVTETRGPGGGTTIDVGSADAVGETTPATRPAGDPVIDRQDVVRQAAATTVRLPLGKRVLLSGMTLEPAAPTADARAGSASGSEAKAAAGRQLYLVVEVDSVK